MESIPLPEHPRPDYYRADWINLNGPWSFRFDKDDAGEADGWHRHREPFPQTITVPFSWAAPLSGVKDDGDIGWYAREIEVPIEWRHKRVFLVIGAADWQTTAWLDGHALGRHEGGYTPFSFEITEHVRPGAPQDLVLRVDDAHRPFKLEGKQGYGPARGIWQTAYLEARGSLYLDAVHVAPDVDAERVVITAALGEAAAQKAILRVEIRDGDRVLDASGQISLGSDTARLEVFIPQPHLWSLEDPHLYDVVASVSGPGLVDDSVETYFGMRKISVVSLPGTDYRYVAVNGDPVYLQLALDQAYHPDGFYTFPSDDFIRAEMLRARQIGLNGLRVHVKIGLPRKLYWADRLGMLVMADIPNSWGQPDSIMRRETEHALRQMIRRDFNHPSIFAWVLFNETWGLYTEVESEGHVDNLYLPETKDWVVSLYEHARRLDPTRLVEDNSPCCGRGHTRTDLNSWHDYKPGWAWKTVLDSVSANTFPGSSWNFEQGFTQGSQPNVNSEFGNVWGYEGSTGDVDWSWDYHRAVNEFRRHPAVAGWLYTELHDVINEWNGYWRYDRTEKFTGLDELVNGMSLRDLHAPLYLSTGGEISRDVDAGATIDVPVFASFMTGSDAHGDSLRLAWDLQFWDRLGDRTLRTPPHASRLLAYRAWLNEQLEPVSVKMPDEPGLALLELRIEDPGTGYVFHRNFTTFVVNAGPKDVVGPIGQVRITAPPASFHDAEWTQRQWQVLDGLKVNGTGAGHFTYRFPWPEDLAVHSVVGAAFVVEASAKRLHGKDLEEKVEDIRVRSRSQ
jgi:hypothetical protein